MSSVDMDNTVNKLLLVIFILILCSSCVTEEINYSSFLIPSSIFVEEDVIFGFLKMDITLKTPYGEMKIAAIGRESGYFFDFSCYKNGNLKMIWLKEEKTIFYNNMYITLPVFEPDKLMSVVFFDNFNIQTCIATNEVIYLGTKIPANTCFHFNKDGTLRSFTLYQDWIFENILYLDGQQFHIIDEKIIPWK